MPREAPCILIGVLLYSGESQKEIQVPIGFPNRGGHQGVDGKKIEELITMEFKSTDLLKVAITEKLTSQHQYCNIVDDCLAQVVTVVSQDCRGSCLE